MADAMESVPGSDEEAVVARDDVPASDPVVAPLVEPDQGWIADDEAAVVAMEAVGHTGPLSAEESAIHVLSEDEAPGLTWTPDAGYLDES